ncbi:ATP-binding protein [Desnuesiella massiliensis]|uniref:ATP-binding protein n=1 Tax=Desnuesiella massiliensis TaxID=1650662 RepID=UPI0006E145B7|nr:sensor histidine kinase [Desnuesiella massiliensis]
MKLQKKITLLIIAILLFTLSIAVWFSVKKMKELIKDQMGKNAMDIATSVASMKEVQDNLLLPNGSTTIQYLIEKIRLKTRVQFITVMDMNAIRYSHPIPDNVGKKFSGGDEDRVLTTGESYITEGIGTLGKSLRAFTPIYKDGEQIGAVCVGILTGWISQEFKNLLYDFLPYILLAMVIGVTGAALLSLNIKKTILGLEPKEIAWMVMEKQAIIESMNEGLIAINREGKITLLNKAGRDILGLKGDYVGKNILSEKYSSKFVEVLNTKKPIYNVEEKLKAQITIMSNYCPLIDERGELMGVLASFQDLTKVKQMAEELTGIKQMTWDLRAQNHEFMNKLHTISGLIQLEKYDKALDFIYDTTKVRNDILDILTHRIKDVTLSALILAKYNKASEARIDFKIHEGCSVRSLPRDIREDELCCVVGNLIENSIDAVIGKAGGFIKIKVLQRMNEFLIEVTNNGEAIPKELGDSIYEKGISTKEGERGYGLYNVKQILNSVNGTISYITGEETIWSVKIPMNEVEV